ncbi:MAG: T9SS type A sorting domain-containing protein [Pedobacter sp.]|nr:MAG: T9SS type A sorting domain-containing protein [Pedobacter sp.]
MTKRFSARIYKYSLLLLILSTCCFAAGAQGVHNDTLDVVNWNLEFFGDNADELPEEMTKARTIMNNLDADVYALAEVVSEPRLANVVSQMPGYAYVISDYGSHTNTNDPQAGPLAAAQKLAFVYKTSVITPVGVPVPLVSQGSNTTADLSNPAFNYFASGRFPYMMTADVNLGGITKQVRFILIHAKANTSPTATSYARRKSGSDTLHQVLNSMYPNDNIMILGDFNDDLDSTITDGINPKTTSYIAFKNDNANFSAPTLALSLAGKKSTVSYNDMIDHVVLSNEMSSFYMGGTASVLTDVSSLVANYGSTTTDHYPVFTRYAFDPLILPVSLLNFEAAKQTSSVVLNWSTAQEVNSKHFIVERSNDGNTWTAIATINAAGNSSTTRNYTYTDLQPLNGINAYRLKQVDMDSRAVNSMVRSVLFSKKYEVKITPNPATDFIKVYIAKDNRVNSSVILTDINGKRIKQYSTTDQLVAIPATGLAKGTYLVTVITNGDTQTQKIIVQ